MTKRSQATKSGQPSQSKPKALKPSPGAAPVRRNPGEQEGVKVAQAALRPTVHAAFTFKECMKVEVKDGDLLKIGALIGELAKQVEAVNGGDLSRGEEMLVVQAHSLDALFNILARRAMANVGVNLEACEMYLKLALRSQSQSRQTVETLAMIKNPPTVFARQANLTTGPQQINNGLAPSSRAREIENEQNKLSGGGNELLPDTSASAPAGRNDPQMATVGEIDRAEIS